MQFAAAATREVDTVQAANQLVASVRRQMSGPVSFVSVYFTSDHQDGAAMLSQIIRQELSPEALIGCSCEGVIGGDREIEREPGISLLAGSMPGVCFTPIRIGMEEWDRLLDGAAVERLRTRLGTFTEDAPKARAFLLLGDPFTTPITELMEALDGLGLAVPTVGGMASGSQHAGENLLLLNDKVFDEGVVGFQIAGPVLVETVVSQGCRPVGHTLLVTRADGNMIETFGGRPAYDVARELLNGLSDNEKELVGSGLYLGVVIDEYRHTFSRGDFLVRGVMGADPASGAVAIGDVVRPGQTVQFHVRDAETADEDLRELMAKSAQNEIAPRGGLIFSCNGRGVRLFDLPNHDIKRILDAAPETPLAGFFAAGELGPIGGRSFIHGQTVSIVLFRPDASE